MRKLLLVDDDPNIVDGISRVLRHNDCYIFKSYSALEALDILADNSVGVVIADQKMPFMSGSQFLMEVKKRYPQTVRIILSGHLEIPDILDCINSGDIFRFITKPWDSNIIFRQIKEAFEYHELNWKKAQLVKLFEYAHEGIIIFDEQGSIQSANPAFSIVTGFQTDDIIDKQFNLLIDEPQSKISYLDIIEYLRNSKQWAGELILRHKYDSQFIASMSITEVPGEHCDTLCYAALFVDITKQKNKEKQIEYQAYHDILTGLANRSLFLDHLELALAQAKRHGQQGAVFFIDLDKFKSINDTLGHDVGDLVLIEVAKRLKISFRQDDTVARFGGDEFTVLIQNVMDVQAINNVADKIEQLFCETLSIGDYELPITLSLGVALYPKDGTSSNIILRHADTAMYLAKNNEGHSIQFYDEGTMSSPP